MALPEVLAATVICGLVLAALPAFYHISTRIWGRETARLQVVQRSEVTLQRIARDIRNAREFAVSSDGRQLTLLLPRRTFDSAIGADINQLTADGQLLDGNCVTYYWSANGGSSSLNGGTIRRRELDPDGAELSDRAVTDLVFPHLNPLESSTAAPGPLFSYDPSTNLVSAIVTTAEPLPSSGDFEVTEQAAKCRRDGAPLARVLTEGSPEGELRCTECGSSAILTAVIRTRHVEATCRNQ
jgi:hypothetical protein